MSENCFLRQEATLEIISNVTNFCAQCYSDIDENTIIFYDMQNCRYLCEACQEKYQGTLDENCEPLNSSNNSLF